MGGHRSCRLYQYDLCQQSPARRCLDLWHHRHLQRLAEFRADLRLSTHRVELECGVPGIFPGCGHAGSDLQILTGIGMGEGEWGMAKHLLAICAAAVMLGAPILALAQANPASAPIRNPPPVCPGPISPWLAALLARFPAGGP